MPIPIIDSEEFQEIVDNLPKLQSDFTTELDRKLFQEEANAFVYIMCDLYGTGSKLDRKKIWDRLCSGIRTAAGMSSGGDITLFASKVLDYISSDDSKSVSNDALRQWIETMLARGRASCQAFVLYCETQTQIMLAQARYARLERMKTEGRLEQYKQESEGEE